jgi:hypothetical protein
MKYCSSVVIGGIDAYLYHMGDEFSKAFGLALHLAFGIKQIWYIHGKSLHPLRVSETKWEWDKEIIFVIYNFTQSYL